jgi:AcrR family transcriptional regulator
MERPGVNARLGSGSRKARPILPAVPRTAGDGAGAGAGPLPGEAAPANGARERVLEAAYELFSRQGVRAVGVDTIIERAGVAKMSFYRHFPSKDDLVLAFLARREERWTRAWLEGEVRSRVASPEDRLLAIFDVFDAWFRRDDFEGCSFINTLLEVSEPGHPVREASVAHLSAIRTFIAELCEGAGIADPDGFARKWHILMKGSIVAAGEGDSQAARRAREVGSLLLASELSRAAPPLP